MTQRWVCGTASKLRNIGSKVVDFDSVAHLGVPHCPNYLIVSTARALLTKFQICAFYTFSVRYCIIAVHEDKTGEASVEINKILNGTLSYFNTLATFLSPHHTSNLCRYCLPFL